jgi:hypothetical protein
VERSERLTKEVSDILGTPQTIYKIPLHDIPDEELVGVEIPSLIDRIIIGPCNYPLPIYKAFLELLTAAGVSDAANRIKVSNIPLRV